MKKIYSLFILSVLTLNLWAYGEDPELFHIPEYMQSNIAIDEDNIWLQVQNGDSLFIDHRLLSTKELVERYYIGDITSGPAFSLDIDSEGNPWLGTDGEGIIRIVNNEIQNITSQRGLPDDDVKDFFFDGDTVWVATNLGIGKFYNNTWETINETDGLPENNISSILKDFEGNIWVGTESTYAVGVCKWDGVNWTVYDETDGLGDDRVNTLIEGANGVIWAGTYNNGVSKIEAGLVTQYGANAGINGTNINELAIDGQGHIWAADNNGNLNMLNGNTFVAYDDDVDLLGDRIYSLCFENDMIYASTYQGIMKFNNSQIDYLAFGYGHYQLTAIDVDDEGRVYLATDNSHLLYIRDETGNWEVENPQQGMGRWAINDIAVSEQGTIAVGTNSNGLFVKRNNEWTQVSSEQYSEIYSYYGDKVLDIDFDSNDDIWFVTMDGAYFYSVNSIFVLPSVSSQYDLNNDDQYLRGVTIDNNNNAYFYYTVGYWGITKWDGTDITYYPQPEENLFPNGSADINYIYDIEVDSLNQLWLAQGYGYTIFSDGEYNLITFENNMGLIMNVDFTDMIRYEGVEKYTYFLDYNDVIHIVDEEEIVRELDYDIFYIGSMVMDSNGDIWLNTGDGLYCLKTPPEVNFSISDSHCVMDTTSMSNSSFDHVTNFQWDINNDGSIEYTTENISHVFEEPGTYEVKLTASNNEGTNFIVKEIVVLENPNVNITSSTGSEMFCNNSLVTLSTSEFASYLWNNGSVESNIGVTSVGVYSVTVTNDSGCEGVGSFDLIAYPTPEVEIVCDPENGLICPSGENAMLTASATGATSLQWSTGVIGNSITVQNEGNYIVSATDIRGCVGTASFELNYYEPVVEQLGVVSAGGNDEYMIVAWERTDTNRIVSYNVYREVGTQYQLQETIPYESLSIYLDYEADFVAQAYSYKLTTTDQCHSESALSESTAHTSMHLQKNVFEGDYQLSWSPYRGIDVQSYTIYEVLPGLELDSITTVNSSSTSYTVVDYSEGSSFRVGVDLPSIVQPSGESTLKSESGPYSQALSNISEMEITNIADDKKIADILVFPTVATDNLNVVIVGDEVADYSIVIINALGERIISKKVSQVAKANEKIAISNIPAGMYSVVIENQNGSAVKGFVKR